MPDGRAPQTGTGPVDPVDAAEVWDEGLAPQRTQLAWGRTGLAVVVAVAVLARNVRTLHGAVGVVGLVSVAAGALAWLVGMRASRRLEETMEPHGAAGTRAFSLITGGTVLLAVGGLLFGIVSA